jgi:hypothetical protein
MRRVAATVVFAMLGFVSLWLWMGVDEGICARFPQLCIRYGCKEIGECPMSFWDEFIFFSVVFGPAIAFGIAAAVFSMLRPSWHSWLLLLFGLVTVHWVVMLVDRLV